MKKLTREEAINLFRQQWADMQKELGDCPNWEKGLYIKQNGVMHITLLIVITVFFVNGQFRMIMSHVMNVLLIGVM